VSVYLSNGEVLTYFVELQPQQESFATGLFSLTRSGAMLGIFFLIIIGIYYLWSYKYSYVPYKKRKFSSGPSLVRAASETYNELGSTIRAARQKFAYKADLAEASQGEEPNEYEFNQFADVKK
ncbi:MAG: hypothetical protein Q7K42_03705, partial [Candidatus Diapherotrites archaeon]|nr:hypothetical protein [Candidatus Diapherotrites archaeon]